MRFGICFNLDYHPEVHGTARAFYNVMLEQTVLLEKLGYDSAWYSEHHSGPYSFGNPALMIAAAAVQTSTIKLGTGVSLLPLHHPLALSEEYAMLDQMTDGRLEYGIGRGYLNHEYPWFGIDNAESSARYRESVEFIIKAWTTEGKMSFEGQYYPVSNYTPFPPVVQKPLPRIFSSASSPDSFPFAAAHNLDLGLALFVPRLHEALPVGVAEYKRVLAENGFARADRQIMGITQMFCVATEAEAVDEGARYAKNYFQFFGRLIADQAGMTPQSQAMVNTNPRELNENNQTLFGTPQMLVDKIGRMQERLDLDYLQFEVAQGGLEPSRVNDVLQLFAEEVIPHFRDAPARQSVAA
jgi:alkanesulfonate monooxygenase SsuD/methylene tetrahydromethanopterin reductase-like flavin-dependent oxidoreductase (luciferase family)